ncbi:fibroblast growth factor receptor substrate 2-like [Argonauta hians]
MGCIYSRSDLAHTRRVFRVYNVDDNGLELNAGKIEVGEQDLILYQKGKETIRWPVRCLRRYGCDAELFSFESGRRCPTGPAIFAFKCQHAEELFNLVQECIQRAGQEERANQSHLGSTNRLHSRPNSMIENPDHNGTTMMISNRLPQNGLMRCNNNNNNNGMRLYVNGSTVADSTSHDYINAMPQTPTGVTDSTTPLLDMEVCVILDDSAVNYAVLDLPKSTENLCDESIDSQPDMVADGNGNYGDSEVFTDIVEDQTSNRNYINVTADCNGDMDQDVPSVATLTPAAAAAAAGDGNYANVAIQNSPVLPSSSSTSPCLPHPSQVQLKPVTQSQPFHALPPPPPVPLLATNEGRKVTYIQLDLNRSSDNLSSGGCVSPTSPLSFSSFPESPGKRTESYAEIDFNKTAALSSSAKSSNENDLGLRKTRHNSTISDLGY